MQYPNLNIYAAFSSISATLHLYFARFFNHFLCDSGYLKHREPFTNLLVQGMVMGQSYRVKGTGEYLRPDQVDFSSKSALWVLVWFMVFNATFNNILVISSRSVLSVEETGLTRENHQPVARH